MPLYDYECDRCRHLFELRQGFDAEPVATCPICQGNAQRRFHSVAVIFRGSGWYTTDYAHRNSLPADQKRVDQDGSGKPEAAAQEGAKAKEEAKAQEG